MIAQDDITIVIRSCSIIEAIKVLKLYYSSARLIPDTIRPKNLCQEVSPKLFLQFTSIYLEYIVKSLLKCLYIMLKFTLIIN